MIPTRAFRALLALAFLTGPGAVSARSGPIGEWSAGLFAHGVRKPFRASLPPGFIYEGEEEAGTRDVELLVRTRPMKRALKPRLTAKLMINTGGRTSFAALGAEWRQSVARGRVYGQVGIGLAVHDGYRFTPDPMAPGLSADAAAEAARVWCCRTAFGSRLLFNPSLSLGARLTNRVAIEGAYEHFSHAGLMSSQNPGINIVGMRLVIGASR